MTKRCLFLLTVAMAVSNGPAKAVVPVGRMSIRTDTEFDAGTFTITAAIRVDAHNITVSGAGQGKTIIRVADGNTTGFNVFVIRNRRGVVVEDLTIDGNSNTLTWNPAWPNGERHWNGFYITDTSNSTIRNVTVVNAGKNGLIWEAGINDNNHVLDSTFMFSFSGWVAAGGGVHPGGGAYMVVDNSTIERCYAEGNSYHGLGMAGDNNTIRDSEAVGNSRGGIVLNGARNSLMENNLSIGNSEGLVNVGVPDSPGQQNILRTNTALNSLEHGIYMNVRHRRNRRTEPS
jgi:nitrous oxidase accessory protein NosD